jgi:hypothetical protein
LRRSPFDDDTRRELCRSPDRPERHTAVAIARHLGTDRIRRRVTDADDDPHDSPDADPHDSPDAHGSLFADLRCHV